MGVFVCIVLLLATPAMTANVYARQCSNALEDNPQNAHAEENQQVTSSEPIFLNMVTRSQWQAKPPRDVAEDMALPIPYVVIIHTVTSSCVDLASCSATARIIQSFHLESKHWADIAYNFLIGGDGKVYEGRGWNKAGAHSKSYNSKSLGVAFIGDFQDHIPSKSQLEAAKSLIEFGVSSGKLANNYKLFGHRQLIPTLSPGDSLYSEIQKWPHFTASVN